MSGKSQVSLVSCQQISKSFGDKPLFEEFSFGVYSGDRLGIIGPNGSGKTTLLNILAQREVADKGEITVSRGLCQAYLAQQDQFKPDMTIELLLESTLADQRLELPQLQKRIAKVRGIFGTSPLSTTIAELSGGWRKRLAIACQILKEPELLLLDEPTNHLDLEGIQWLEEFLISAPFALVMVSHDRTFLENVSNRVLEINPRFPKGFFAVEGKYTRFLEKREEHLRAIQDYEDSLANRVRRELEWLRRGPKARATKANARIDEAHRLISELKESQSRSQQKSATEIEFTSSGRKTKRLLTVEGVSKSFEQKKLFENLDLVLSQGSRVGLLGSNGSGKTTLLNILAARLEPDQGTIERVYGLKTVLFNQNRDTLDLQLTLARTLAPDSDGVVFQGRAQHVASYASRFLFRGDILNQPVGSLSGGEQARLLIARLMLEPADILLLDEPTNDLDIDTLEVLEESLEEFSGAVVLVTHDRLMLNRICSLLIGLEAGQAATVYADYSQWLKRSRIGAAKSSPKEQPKTKQNKGQSKKLSYREKLEWEQIEARIAQAEAMVKHYESELKNPEVVATGEKLQQTCLQLDQAQQTVDMLYDRWAELSERQT